MWRQQQPGWVRRAVVCKEGPRWVGLLVGGVSQATGVFSTEARLEGTTLAPLATRRDPVSVPTTTLPPTTTLAPITVDDKFLEELDRSVIYGPLSWVGYIDGTDEAHLDLGYWACSNLDVGPTVDVEATIEFTKQYVRRT